MASCFLQYCHEIRATFLCFAAVEGVPSIVSKSGQNVKQAKIWVFSDAKINQAQIKFDIVSQTFDLRMDI